MPIYHVIILLIIFIASCASAPQRTSTQPPKQQATKVKTVVTVQSSKDEEQTNKIDAFKKKVQELEHQKSGPVELQAPNDIAVPYAVQLAQYFEHKELGGQSESKSLTQVGSLTTVGVAYLGSENTLEEAKTVALIDAQLIALNKLGVFVEASQTVQEFQLTQDEVRSITGAIMKSHVIKEEKKVQDKTFTLYLTLTSEISLVSLREALENYQNRSHYRNLIQQLMVTSKRLWNELAEKKASGTDELELVEELMFLNQTINEYLTTKMVIDKELEIQEIFINKFKYFLKKEIFPLHRESLIKHNRFNIVRRLDKEFFLAPDHNYLNSELKMLSEKILNKYISIFNEYNNLNLKTKPRFNLNLLIELPLYIYTNEKKYEFVFIYTIYSDRNGDNDAYFSFKCSTQRYSLFENYYRIKGHVKYNKNNCSYFLEKKYTLRNIQSIKIRYGRHKIIKAKIE